MSTHGKPGPSANRAFLRMIILVPESVVSAVSPIHVYLHSNLLQFDALVQRFRHRKLHRIKSCLPAATVRNLHFCAKGRHAFEGCAHAQFIMRKAKSSQLLTKSTRAVTRTVGEGLGIFKPGCDFQTLDGSGPEVTWDHNLACPKLWDIRPTTCFVFKKKRTYLTYLTYLTCQRMGKS